MRNKYQNIKYHRISGIYSLIWPVFWLFISCCVYADQETTVDDLLNLSLEELLNYEVSAPTRKYIKLSDTPGSVSVITYDQIRSSGATTIPELLRLIPGVHVRWNPMVQSIEIRSFGSNPFTSRVLLLIDGVPYNSWNKGGFPQHPGFDFFNLENVKHLEVIRGAGSALYGENALNGVINIVTLSGDEYRQTRISVLAGDRNTRTAGFSHGSKLSEDASIFVSARAEKTELPTQFWEGKESTGEDFFFKSKYKQLEVSYYRRQDDFDGFTDLIIPPNFNFQSAEHITQKVNIAAANFQHKSSDEKWSFKANASYANRDGSHCGSCHASSQDVDFNGELDHGSQKLLNLQLGLHYFNQHDWLIGVESRDNTSGEAFEEVTTGFDGSEVLDYSKHAVFIQDHMSFLKDKLKVVAGVRYDSKTSPDLFDGELFPRLSVVHKSTDHLTVRAGWSVAARYPSFTELYQNIRFFAAESDPGVFAFPPTQFQPNPNLNLEMVDAFELGFEYEFNPKVLTKLDFYYNKVEDPIVLVYTQSTVGFENHPNDANVKGVEFELRATPTPNLSTFFNWSYQHNRQTGNGVDSAGLPIEFTYAPKHKINGGLTYNITENLKSTFELSWRDTTLAPRFWNDLIFGDNQVHEMDDYAYLNFKLRYRLPFEFSSNKQPLTLNIWGKNLLNERNTETLTGVDGTAPGREFFIGLDYEWAN